MFLKHLSLRNFRNYSQLDLDFSNQTLILVGDNAQGKSNLLESIYFLATTKSPKATRDEEIIKEGQTVTTVSGLLDDQTNLEISLQSLVNSYGTIDFVDQTLASPGGGGVSKRVKVNGVNRRTLDYIGHLAVVLFSPEDINLVSGSPSLRRWHIDLTLAQIDPKYKQALTHYGEVVTKKNRLLKRIREGLSKTDEIDFWSEQQLQFGEIISQKRIELFEFINKSERQFGDYGFTYSPNLLTANRLRDYRGREIAAAASLIGPHRDDFSFSFNNQNLSVFGSRGEHRIGILDLKLSEASFIESQIQTRPILLLDDIFSELDSQHRAYVGKLLKKQQTILVAVEIDNQLTSLLQNNDSQILTVKEATLAAI